jgi:DNA-binding NarL/FixJ family response regulator
MTITVILADDHPIFRQGLVALLQAQTDIALLAQAGTGAEAWRLIETLHPQVAILDVTMPEGGGIEVVRRCEAADLETRTVLLTMHDDPALAIQTQQAGAAGFVLKDNSFEDLILAIRTVAGGGTFVSPVIQGRLRALQRTGRSMAALSERESAVVRLIAMGHSSKEIARRMAVSPRTVDTYRNRAMQKLGLHSLAEVVRYAVKAGMLG